MVRGTAVADHRAPVRRANRRHPVSPCVGRQQGEAAILSPPCGNDRNHSMAAVHPPYRPQHALIRSSFVHLPGISAARESRLWDQGVFDWDDLVNREPEQLDLFRGRRSALRTAVEASELALASGDIAYFGRALPRREHYRIAASFPDRCTFLDIESTGLSTYYDAVTLIGWSAGAQYTALIDPRGTGQLDQVLREFPVVVTFNGTLFDLPFLTKRFDVDWSAVLHVDLRYLARRVGLTGGQKKIESAIGVARDAPLEGVTGAEAVALWFDYKEGDLDALRDLVRYNHADVEGMKHVFEETLHRLSLGATSRPEQPKGLFPRTAVTFDTTCGSSGRCRGRVDRTSRVPISPYRGAVGPKLRLDDLRQGADLDALTVVGIDLTGSEKRKSGWATVTGAELQLARVASDDELIDRTLAAEPYLVSIDSPLSLPAGRQTEFDDDPGREEFGIVRAAERQLRGRGINVYPALLPSMQRLTRRGIELASRLRRSGVPVIESYPGAAQDILGIPRKKTSLRHLLRGLCRFGYADLDAVSGVSHDELDAATSALVGQFMVAGYWEALGSPEEDYLIVPTVEREPAKVRVDCVVGLSGPIAAGKTTAARMLEGMGFRYCRFSEIIEDELRRNGQPTNRDAMQAYGERAHGSRFGQRGIQNKLAHRVGRARKIVVDGLRHPEDRAFLRERWGLASMLVHVSASAEIRARRFAERQGGSEAAFCRADAHPVERHATGMEALADVVLPNVDTLPAFRAALRALMEGRPRCP